MTIILGFGAIESKVRADVRRALIEAVTNNKDVNAVLRRWNDRADEYDKMSYEAAPERYTRVWFYDKTLVFHHINRRHPFSPDGWVMLQIEESFDSPGQARLNQKGVDNV